MRETTTGDRFELDRDPLQQLRAWLHDAGEAGVREPYAMTLATATRDGLPSARMVLLRGLDDRGLVFYTNHDSRKGEELARNPHAALVLYWDALERQVRVTGRVHQVDREESEAYFRSRPPGSRVSAWASPQSRPIASRADLEARYAEVARRFDGGDIPLPPFWGGFRVVPERYEFWRGRRDRLHDRREYTRDASGEWVSRLLAP